MDPKLEVFALPGFSFFFLLLADEPTGLPAATTELFGVAVVEILIVEAGIDTTVVSFTLGRALFEFSSLLS
jgi:hypothetical protein